MLINIIFQSITTIVTEKQKIFDWILLTLSIYHKDTSVYILTTNSVKNIIDDLTPDLNSKLDIHWY